MFSLRGPTRTEKWLIYKESNRIWECKWDRKWD